MGGRSILSFGLERREAEIKSPSNMVCSRAWRPLTAKEVVVRMEVASDQSRKSIVQFQDLSTTPAFGRSILTACIIYLSSS